jgi:hypothetical protein
VSELLWRFAGCLKAAARGQKKGMQVRLKKESQNEVKDGWFSKDFTKSDGRMWAVLGLASGKVILADIQLAGHTVTSMLACCGPMRMDSAFLVNLIV